MKTIYLSIILLFLFTFSVNGQCSKAATNFGNNTSTAMYNVTGMVTVVLNSSTSVSVNLGANFSTAAGPDVHIFLANRGSLTDAMLKMPSNFATIPKIEMGVIPASGAGMASYTKPIPSGMNISTFNTVYFLCQGFNQFWDFGSIVPFTAANCAVLGNSDFEKENFLVYPNPVNDVLNLDLASFENDLKINIYNNVGNLILSKNKSSLLENQLNIAAFSSGMYMLEILDAENNRYIKKFLKN